MAVSGESNGKECPLCLEPFEADDVHFYPCYCEYQVCRFCWHRIRTDENGLCPACRTPYPEDPVNFKPVASETLEKMRHQRRRAQLQRRQQQINERMLLANFRVVPRNLIVVMGIPLNKAKEEVLRRPEYFGQFGKIVKVAFKFKRTGGAPDQPTVKSAATAFITFQKEDFAFNAVNKLDNAEMDGNTLRVTLGTTKYCSFFLRGLPCHRFDCMYMHQPGEPAARFSAEDMDKGRHLEYQQKLIQQYIDRTKKTPKREQRTVVDRDEPDAEFIGFNYTAKPSADTICSTEPLLPYHWDAHEVESDAAVNLNLTSFSLPTYGQSVVIGDPNQPIIHIGHSGYDHRGCCSAVCNESANAMAELNFAFSEELRISASNDGYDAPGAFEADAVERLCGRDRSLMDGWREVGAASARTDPSFDRAVGSGATGGGGGGGSCSDLALQPAFGQRRHRSRSEIGSLKRRDVGDSPLPNHWFERSTRVNPVVGSRPVTFDQPTGGGGGLAIHDAVSYESTARAADTSLSMHYGGATERIGASSLPITYRHANAAFDPFADRFHQPSSYPSNRGWP